jgi:hypothetical protein
MRRTDEGDVSADRSEENERARDADQRADEVGRG